MTRRALLSLAAVSAFAQQDRRRAQSTQSGFPGAAYRDYSRCLPDYLRQLARASYEKRNREIDKLVTKDAILARQRWTRETLWTLIGGMRERTPLNARTVGSFERNGYRVEKVVYESRPNFPIPANLYIPASSKPPFPGVLFQMGHADNGKAHPAYQRFSQGLAQLGYLVLAFDPMGQGERVNYPDSFFHHTRLPSSDDEHTLPGKQMLLFGDTVSRMQVWDAIRSLDYLAAHPLVDPKRLASTGHSGGATVTMLLAATDDRLAAAAVCMGNTENVACANFIPPGSTDDAEQNFVGAGPLGFDRWDLLYPLAPKPLLVSISDQDFYSTYSPNYVSSGWEEYQKLKAVYRRIGQPDHLAWADTALPHELAYACRLQIYNWFAKWLKGESQPVKEEPQVKPEPDATLWTTEGGSVIKSLKSATPFLLNKSRVVERRPSALDRLLVVDHPSPANRMQVLARDRSGKVTVEAVQVHSAEDVWVPAWLLLPEQVADSKPALLVLDPAGRSTRWFAGEVDQVLPEKSPIICAADVRGIGDMTPETGRGAVGYARWHSAEENYAWGSLILGRPLLGQRVTDILAVVAALRAHPALSGRPIRIAAFGKLTIPALFAAAIDPAIQDLYLAGGLLSFRDIVDTESYNHPFANFVPGLLNHTDLPDVVAALAPRRVHLAGPVDAKGAVPKLETVRSLYAAASNVEVSDTAKWTVEILTQLV